MCAWQGTPGFEVVSAGKIVYFGFRVHCECKDFTGLIVSVIICPYTIDLSLG